jgi:hypothetical protein
MKHTLILLGLITMIVNACSPFTNVQSGEQPTPVMATEPAFGYQPLAVSQVDVDACVGSSIPVQVLVSGNLPIPVPR